MKTLFPRLASVDSSGVEGVTHIYYRLASLRWAHVMTIDCRQGKAELIHCERANKDLCQKLSNILYLVGVVDVRLERDHRGRVYIEHNAPYRAERLDSGNKILNFPCVEKLNF